MTSIENRKNGNTYVIRKEEEVEKKKRITNYEKEKRKNRRKPLTYATRDIGNCEEQLHYYKL